MVHDDYTAPTCAPASSRRFLTSPEKTDFHSSVLASGMVNNVRVSASVSRGHFWQHARLTAIAMPDVEQHHGVLVDNQGVCHII